MSSLRPPVCTRAPDRTGAAVTVITFPGESPEYRAARDRLRAQEIELRRAMDAGL